MGGVSFGGEHPTMLAPSGSLCFAHPASHSVAADASALIAQFPVDARTPLSASVLFKHLPKLLGEESIFSFALPGRALAPGRKAPFRDSEDLAHDHESKCVLGWCAKLLGHWESREQMLRPFLSLARSRWTRSRSRLSRRFSSSSALWCPLPGNASWSCCAHSLRQW